MLGFASSPQPTGYDGLGSLVGYNDSVTSAVYTYDDLKRKTGETVDYGAFSLTNTYEYYNNSDVVK